MAAVDVIQLILNGGVLVAGGWVWKLYVDNLKAGLTSKDSELSLVKTDRDLWKGKVVELEKRSPEAMEKLLSERIEIRDRELARLGEDRQKNEQALDEAEQEMAALQSDLRQTRGFRQVLELEGDDDEDVKLLESLLGPGDEIEVVELGEVAVDSGMLLLTDPCYIDAEWQEEPYALDAQLEDPSRGTVYVLGTDFDNYGEVLADYGRTPNELLEEGVLVEREVTAPPHYSYNGAAATTLRRGYGELLFKMGHAGAGVVFSTAFGDGVYRVFGEMRNGRIVRIYLNVT